MCNTKSASNLESRHCDLLVGGLGEIRAVFGVSKTDIDGISAMGIEERVGQHYHGLEAFKGRRALWIAFECRQ